jgi:TPR repeat protein
MAKKVRTPLEMGGVQVTDLKELRGNFDLAAVLTYYDNGRLVEWLEERYHEEEAEKIKALKALEKTPADLKKQLCAALGVSYESEADNVDLKDITDKKKKRELLKQYTADDEILDNADKVAFNKDDLLDLLDKGEKVIYLCGDSFDIPSKKGMKYIGVNSPLVNVEAKEPIAPEVISFEGVRFCESYAKLLKEKENDNNIDKLGQGTNDVDPVEVAKKWRMAAEKGDAEAQNELGIMYCNGNGVEQNYREARKWFKKAAEQGNAAAQFNIGEMYWFGRGVEEDEEEAYYYYRDSAKQGYAKAVTRIGDCYYQGVEDEDGDEVVEEDEEEAFEWYNKAAKMGDAEAQYNVGLAYYNGEGVDEDDDEAYDWFHKAAEQGYWKAQEMLGAAYACGNDVIEQDAQKAFEWYRKAAEQGSPAAQMALGEAYYAGNGISKDYDEAFKWFCKAATQEYDKAYIPLAKCYYYGRGVEQSDRETSKWLRKSADPTAERMLEKLADGEDIELTLNENFEVLQGALQNLQNAQEEFKEMWGY